MLHVGDLAYAFGNFTKWNMWFDRIEPTSARVPYMISPGNRDEDQIVTERFRMPPNSMNPSSFYYSFDYLWVHVVSISIKDDYSKGSEQYRWLEQDLQQANLNIQNAANPLRWILLIGHTPLYSSSDGHDRGNKELKASIEELLYRYKVPLAIWGDGTMICSLEVYCRSWI